MQNALSATNLQRVPPSGLNELAKQSFYFIQVTYGCVLSFPIDQSTAHPNAVVCMDQRMSEELITCDSCEQINRLMRPHASTEKAKCGKCGRELPIATRRKRSTKRQRYFEYDAFLSHNQRDGSVALAKVLAELGVNVWHDGDADMSDQKVQAVVQRSLARSRFTCVCVGREFRDSKWVRAEYMTGLAAQQRFGIARVMVVELAPSVAIPETLRLQRRFLAYRNPEQLAAYLRVANARNDIGPMEALVPPDHAHALRRDTRRLTAIGSEHTQVPLEDDEVYNLALARYQRALTERSTDSLIEDAWQDLRVWQRPDAFTYALQRYERAMDARAEEAVVDRHWQELMQFHFDAAGPAVVRHARSRYEQALARDFGPTAEQRWQDLRQLRFSEADPLVRELVLSRYKDALGGVADEAVIEKRWQELPSYGDVGLVQFAILREDFERTIAAGLKSSQIAKSWHRLAGKGEPLKTTFIMACLFRLLYKEYSDEASRAMARSGLDQTLAVYEDLMARSNILKVIIDDIQSWSWRGSSELLEPPALLHASPDHLHRATTVLAAFLKAARRSADPEVLASIRTLAAEMAATDGNANLRQLAFVAHAKRMSSWQLLHSGARNGRRRPWWRIWS